MYYREHLPSRVLRPFVRCLWHLEHDYGRSVHNREHLWASLHTELVIVVRGRYELGTDGASCPVPSAFVMGPRTRARTLYAHGPVSLIAARFAPWSASSLRRVPPSELVNRVVPAAHVLPERSHDLGRLGSLPTHERRTALLDHLLATTATGSEPPERLVVDAVSLIEERAGQISVAQLCRILLVDERRLERRFSKAIGLPPKRVTRIVAFNHVRERLVASGDQDLTHLASELGYADHAHLSRSFREHFGVTPSTFRQETRDRMASVDADVGFVQA